LQHKRWCPADKEEISWADVAKGFEIAKDRFVVISKEDLEAAKLKTTSTVDIVQFVDGSEVDPIYYDKPYYIVPAKGGDKAFWLLKDVLAATNKVAIGRFVLRSREMLVAISSYKKGLLLNTLHYEYEIRDLSRLEELKRRAEHSKEEEQLANQLIESKSSKLDVSKYEDRYVEVVKSIVKAKLAGKKITMPRQKIEKAKELMEALKASVASGQGTKGASRREKKK
jgi:DNA end-binding protein Ku